MNLKRFRDMGVLPGEQGVVELLHQKYYAYAQNPDEYYEIGDTEIVLLQFVGVEFDPSIEFTTQNAFALSKPAWGQR